MKVVFFGVIFTLSVLLSCTVTNESSVKLSSAVEGDISFTVVGVVDLDSLLNRSDIFTRSDLITRSDLTSAGITSPVNIPISDAQSEKAQGINLSRKLTNAEDLAPEEVVVTVNCEVFKDGDSTGAEVFSDENGAFSVEFLDVVGDGAILSCSLYLVVSTAGSSILKDQVSEEDLEQELIGEFVDEYSLTDEVNDQTINVGDVESTEDGALQTDSIEVVDSSLESDEDSDDDSVARQLDVRIDEGAVRSDVFSNGITTANNGVSMVEAEPDSSDSSYLSFDGGSFFDVTLTDDFKNNFGTQFSIEATLRLNEIIAGISPIASNWIFPAAAEAQPIGWFVLFVQPNNESNGYTLHFQIATSDGNGSIGASSISSILQIELGIWTQVLATYDLETSQLKLYIDGVEDTGNCNCANFGTIDIGDEINIGKADTFEPTPFYFTGDIRVLRIYNEVMSPDELE